MVASVKLTATVDSEQVTHLLLRHEYALEPAALATFLQTRVDPILKARARERFQNEGDEIVGRWAPLATATQEIRSQRGYGPAHPINHRTGALERFITGFKADVEVTPYGAKLEIGNRTPGVELRKKLQTAQTGKKKPFTVPRPVLGIGPRDLELVMTALHFHLVDSIRGGP
ncbi:MAG TPA: hypothetical protein VIY48_18010 [Candidatus Paceibacterota bacterium]